MKTPLHLSFLIGGLLLSGCAVKGGWLSTVGPDYQKTTPDTAAHWQAPLPHQGKIETLKNWWAGFNDPALNRLLAAAQAQSATLANAKARIEEARANLVGAGSMFLPKVDGALGGSYSSFSFGQAPFLRNQYQLDVQSSWEIDLFGGLARQQEAALSQLQARTAAWHDARVAVAAELANAYVTYRYCQVQVNLAKTDADSRQASAKLVDLAATAGLRNLAETSLAHATASEGVQQWQQQLAQCERTVKSLVAMTGLAEPELRKLLAHAAGQVASIPTPPPVPIQSVPAKALLQRPDVAIAERNLAEASAKIGVEQAKRFPKLSLSGNITPVFQNINGAALTLAETWSIGPTLSLPLFDAGKRAANVEAAKADYDAIAVQYRATVRKAVQEVEEALVRLASADGRLPLAQSAAADYRNQYQAAQQLYAAGLGNLLDAETARRTLVAADLNVQTLQHEKASAWIALYRAVGGGWDGGDVAASR